jgi:hypothetical protein
VVRIRDGAEGFMEVGSNSMCRETQGERVAGGTGAWSLDIFKGI